MMLLSLMLGTAQASTLLDRAEEILPDAVRYYDYFADDLAGAGDVNGDGYDDVLFGAPTSDGFEEGGGKAYLVPGGPSGLDLDGTEPITAGADAPDGVIGRDVAGGCDVNGDGYDDVVLAVQDHYVTEKAGALMVVPGSASGLDRSGIHFAIPDDVETGVAFASDTDCAGDVDGDGYDDILTGATYSGNTAWVVRGGPDGLTDDRSFTVEPPLGDDDDFGAVVAPLGDLDRDGYADFAVGGSDDGTFVFMGGPDGPTFLEHGWFPLPTDGEQVPAGGGDVDGDGFDDLLVGNPEDDAVAEGGGSFTVYYGSVNGIDPDREDEVTLDSVESGDGLGGTLRIVGDIDGDGYDDILAGLPAVDVESGPSGGTAYVWFGGADGVDTDRVEHLDPDVVEGGDRWGTAIAGAGDVDGNGAADMLVGSYALDWDGFYSGGAHILYGDCTGDVPMYRDADGDRYGDEDIDVTWCQPPAGWTTEPGDCDDDDDDVNPDAVEVPGDGVDQDCDGFEQCYADADGDGYRTDDTVDSTDLTCDGPGEADADAEEDCDDTDADVSPAGEEGVADGVDGDCDGDELCWVDDDGDGYLLDGATVESADLDCEDWSEADGTALPGDCDDDDPAVHPGAGCDEADAASDGSPTSATLALPAPPSESAPAGSGDVRASSEPAAGCSAVGGASSLLGLLVGLLCLPLRRRR